MPQSSVTKKKGKDLKMRIDIPVTRFRRRDRETVEVGGGRWPDGGAEGRHEREGETFVIFLL